MQGDSALGRALALVRELRERCAVERRADRVHSASLPGGRSARARSRHRERRPDAAARGAGRHAAAPRVSDRARRGAQSVRRRDGRPVAGGEDAAAPFAPVRAAPRRSPWREIPGNAARSGKARAAAARSPVSRPPAPAPHGAPAAGAGLRRGIRLARRRRSTKPKCARRWPSSRRSYQPRTGRPRTRWPSRSATCCSRRSTCRARSASHPDLALDLANAKFRDRFEAVERMAREARDRDGRGGPRRAGRAVGRGETA